MSETDPWEKPNNSNSVQRDPWETEDVELDPWESPSDATQATPKNDSGSLTQMLAPSAYKQYQEMKKGTYERTTPLRDNAKLFMKTVFDMTDVPKRIAGGDILNPESNFWETSRQNLRDFVDRGMKSSEQSAQEAQQKYANGHWTDALPDSDPDKYLLDPRQNTADPLWKKARIAGDTFFELAGDPFMAKSMVVGSMKKLGGMSLKGVPKSDLIQHGFKLSPAQATEMGKTQSIREAKELAAQANPYTQSIPAKMADENLDIVTNKVSGSSADLIGKDVAGVRHGESRGELIQKAGEKVQEIGGKLYRKGEDVVTKPLDAVKLPGTTKQIKKQVKSNLVDEAGNPIMNEKITEVFTNNASKGVDKLLETVGYKGGKIPETAKVSSATIKGALEYKKMIAEANTMGELINVKRHIDDQIFQGVKDGIFVGDKNKAFLKRINPSLNESIEEAIKKQLPKEYRDQYAKAYRAINKQISKTMDIMKEPSKTLKLGKSGFNSDKVLNSIQSIPPQSLKDLKASATTRPLYEELQRGAFENLILKSSPKDGFSPTKFRTAWTNMGTDFKKSIFPDDMIKDMDKYLESYAKTQKGNLKLANPSGTAAAKATIENASTIMSGGKNLLKGLFKYHAIKHYYKSGKSVTESALNLSAKGGRGAEKLLDNKIINAIESASTFGDFFKSEYRKE